MGAHHPESPARINAIEDQLIASGLLQYLQHHDAPEATREQLLRVHDEVYVALIEASTPHQGIVDLDGDTALNPFSYQAALRAAGAVVLGVDMVMGKKVENAFCNVRPPGHHAARGRAMGFCIFNNVAVGAAHALAQHGLQRVAIADSTCITVMARKPFFTTIRMSCCVQLFSIRFILTAGRTAAMTISSTYHFPLGQAE